MIGRSEQTDLVMTCINGNFAFVHEIHANKCVYLQVFNERNGVGNMGAGDYDRERICLLYTSPSPRD